MPRLVKPNAIASGATLGIAAPAGPADPEKLDAGRRIWRDAGFRVKCRDDVVARCGYLAGDDTRRAEELMSLGIDPEVDAIVCARGGYGCQRILEDLDPAAFRAARKPLVGFSDVTTLLLWQRRRAGLIGFHGPMLDRGGDIDRGAFEALVSLLRGTSPPPRLVGRAVSGGVAEGRLVGGNLVLVVASLGTSWEVDTRGAILLVEEVGERPYAIDRMFQQLRGAGKLAGLAGLGIGELSACVDDRCPEPTALEVLAEIARPLGIPVVAKLPFGHVRDNRAWPVGARATIDGDRGEVRILERGVSKTT